LFSYVSLELFIYDWLELFICGWLELFSYVSLELFSYVWLELFSRLLWLSGPTHRDTAAMNGHRFEFCRYSPPGRST